MSPEMNPDFLSVFLSTVYMGIAYTGLLTSRMKIRYYVILFIWLFTLYWGPDIYWGQLCTFLLVAGCSLIIYLGCRKNLLDLVFALTGHLLLIFINHICTIPLSMMGKSIPYLISHRTINIFYFVMILTNFPILRLLRRYFILPRLPILSACPKKLLLCLLAEIYTGLALMTTNFIYGEALSYPTEVLSLNGLIISVFTLITVLIFCNMYDILKKNHELTLQQAQSAIMQDYARRMESLYEEIRAFRHDQRNILATMQHYIDEENTEGLKEYFHKTILRGAPVLSDDGFTLGRLHRLEDDAVKSLLYTKAVAILNHEISFELEIAEKVPLLPMDSLTLCRILGILLDNALEASLDSAEKLLRIAIVTTDTAVLFSITNSTRPLPVPVSSLLKRGYSSKEGHEGIGLATAATLLDRIPQADLSIKYEQGDTSFYQILEIQRNDDKK